MFCFRRIFKNIKTLLDQKQEKGGLAILKQSKRFIYYLVTKSKSTGKPTYVTFWKSCKCLRDHISSNKVTKLAIPRLGCGLDRLEWTKIKLMIEFLFLKVPIEILVCNI